MVVDGEVREFGNHLISNTGEVCWKKRPDKPLLGKNGNPGNQYRCFKHKKKVLRQHQVIARLFCKNPRPDIFKEVDHADQDKVYNHWRNLRWVNRTLNQLNKGKGYHKHTQYNGEQVWRVEVWGKYHGWFATEQKLKVFREEYKRLTGLDNAGVGDEMYLS